MGNEFDNLIGMAVHSKLLREQLQSTREVGILYHHSLQQP